MPSEETTWGGRTFVGLWGDLSISRWGKIDCSRHRQILLCDDGIERGIDHPDGARGELPAFLTIVLLFS